MGWKYEGGLLLIVGVVIMWVTSAELTQGVFEDYRHLFPVSYLGTSLLALYLPIAFFKDWLDWLVKHLRGRSCNNTEGPKGVDKFSVELNSPVKHDDKHVNFQTEHQSSLPKECVIDFCTKEEGNPLVSRHEDIMEAPERDIMLSAKEIAAFGFCMAAI
ncbi:hypothetical protein CRYUN_Cryun02cG0087400 [Craigia yunnanensis]